MCEVTEKPYKTHSERLERRFVHSERVRDSGRNAQRLIRLLPSLLVESYPTTAGRREVQPGVAPPGDQARTPLNESHVRAYESVSLANK